MAAGDGATCERELQDLGIAPGPVAAETRDAEERRERELLPPDERRYWSGTLIVPYRWICSIEAYRSNPRWGGHGQARWLLHGRAPAS